MCHFCFALFSRWIEFYFLDDFFSFGRYVSISTHLYFYCLWIIFSERCILTTEFTIYFLVASFGISMILTTSFLLFLTCIILFVFVFSFFRFYRSQQVNCCSNLRFSLPFVWTRFLCIFTLTFFVHSFPVWLTFTWDLNYATSARGF